MVKFELDQFAGPLDLLLTLIEDQKMDISQVALAQVADQYLAYLDAAQNISAVELADFLMIATKLLVIKSKILLPQLADEEEDSAEQLEAQLRMYKEYLEASKKIEALIGAGDFCFSREKIAYQIEPAFSPPAGVKVGDLLVAFAEILNRIDYVVNLPQKVLAKAVSLQEKISGLRNTLIKFQKMSFSEILKTVESRTEAVVCFMALLELIKSGEAAVHQKGVFDEIVVEKV